MSQRKRISLPPPADPSASAPEPRRRPPVRGAGTAPRKRPTAAEAAQAREDAQAEAARQAEERGAHAPGRPEGSRPFARDERPARPPRREGAPRRDAPGGRRDEDRARHADDRPPPRAEPRSSPQRPPRQEPARRPPRQEPWGEARSPGRADPRPSHPSRPSRPARDDAAAAPRRPRAARPDVPPGSSSQPAAPGSVRLSKRMSELGLASRREADEWIAQGWVRVDGQVVAELGSRVQPQQQITVDEAARQQQAQRVTVLLHKPIGYVSGQAEDGYTPAVALVTAENRWSGDRTAIRFSPVQRRHLAPAGRLDIDSTGLLVLTQDGRIAKLLIGEDSPIEKEYLVRVRLAAGQPEGAHASELLPPEALERLRHGLELDGVPLQPAKVSWQNEDQLRFVLREGRKRQIRRMCEAVGLDVVGLKRVRIGRIPLGDLPPGQWRYLRPDERF